MINAIVHFVDLLSLLEVQGGQQLLAHLELLSFLLHQQVQGHLEDRQVPEKLNNSLFSHYMRWVMLVLSIKPQLSNLQALLWVQFHLWDQ